MTSKVFFNSVCVAALLLIPCRADIVVVGGSSLDFSDSCDPPTYPIAQSFPLQDSTSTPLNMPNSWQGAIYDIAIDGYRGSVIYAGEYLLSSFSTPLLLKGSVVSETLSQLSLPETLAYGSFAATAIDSEGTATLIGKNQGSNSLRFSPLICRLPSNSTQATQLSIPSEILGELFLIKINSDDTAILVGYNYATHQPLIYLLPKGATTPTEVSLSPEYSNSSINTISITPDGTIFLGGGYSISSTLTPILYTLKPGNLVATAIELLDPPADSEVSQSASDPNGNLLFLLNSSTNGGSVYKIASGSNLGVAIPSSYTLDHLDTLVIDSRGIATLSGHKLCSSIPFINRLNPFTAEFSNIEMPNSNFGIFISSALGSNNEPVLVGAYFDSNQLMVIRVPPESSRATQISTPPLRYVDALYKVAIYNEEGLYDIRRLRPYYYLQMSESQNLLN